MSLNLEKLAADLNRLENITNGSDYLDRFVIAPEGEGSMDLRILPPADGVNLYCPTRLHRINNANVHCPRVLDFSRTPTRWVGDCPICDEYNSLWQRSKSATSKEEEDRLIQEARGIKPNEKYYYAVIVREEKDAKSLEVRRNVGPKIWPVGKQLHQKILTAILGEKTLRIAPLGDITDPEKGQDFRWVKRLRRAGDGMVFPNYDSSGFVGVSSLGTPDQVVAWFANRPDLMSLRRILPHDKLVEEVNKYKGVVTFGDSDIPDVYAPAETLAAVSSPSVPDVDLGLENSEFIANLMKKMK